MLFDLIKEVFAVYGAFALMIVASRRTGSVKTDGDGMGLLFGSALIVFVPGALYAFVQLIGG
jgi:hypothetical protein